MGNPADHQPGNVIDLSVIHDAFIPRSLQTGTPGCAWVSRREREANVLLPPTGTLEAEQKFRDEESDFELKFCLVFWKAQ